MKKIPADFRLCRYGVEVRLVREDDASFILALRTDGKLSRFLHQTDADLGKQLEWMRAYKEREEQGLDYYFIYFHGGKPFGVNRIYGIDCCSGCGTGGSWICSHGTDAEQSVASLLVMRDILFESLGLEYDVFDVRKCNKQVQKLHKMLGAKLTGETEDDFLFRLSKSDYLTARNNLIEMLNLNKYT